MKLYRSEEKRWERERGSFFKRLKESKGINDVVQQMNVETFRLFRFVHIPIDIFLNDFDQKPKKKSKWKKLTTRDFLLQ